MAAASSRSVKEINAGIGGISIGLQQVGRWEVEALVPLGWTQQVTVCVTDLPRDFVLDLWRVFVKDAAAEMLLR